MFAIGRNNKIKLTKGDTAEIDVRVFLSDYCPRHEVLIKPWDKIVFKVYRDEDVLLEKENDEFPNSLFIEEEDTEDMEPGLYTYSLEFRTATELSTFVNSFFELYSRDDIIC